MIVIGIQTKKVKAKGKIMEYITHDTFAMSLFSFLYLTLCITFTLNDSVTHVAVWVRLR